MTRLLILFFFIAIDKHHQNKADIYSVSVGKFKCFPDFYKNDYNSVGILSAVDESQVSNNIPIRFPKRIDTILLSYRKDIPVFAKDTIFVGYTNGLKLYKQIVIRDNYIFEAGIDSININALDTFIRQTIIVKLNEKKLKLISYNFDILYENGERKSVSNCNENPIIDSKECVKALNHKKKIIYIGIWQIYFKNKLGRRLCISKEYGWKIKYK